MKRLKLLIVALGLIAAQGVFAVTLPSTSYTPYSGGEAYSSETMGGGLSAGDFLALGTGTDVCVGDDAGVPSGDYADCTECCMAYFTVDQPDEFRACQTACFNGPSLPLDAPLWFVVMSVVILSVAKNLVRRYRTFSES